ncbi:type II toxin-antitoxin system prevent-host-death family antitoxin [Hydrocarboniphaga effusa]|jgi:prevent-host-death family protein|uniref:type II toxin-antitoxin system prevent-host-death family antitoxin n=1 Tax=Hydrocarboniphaga TaxID=243627 RepID=UPI00344C67A2
MPTKSDGEVTRRPIVNVTLTDVRRRYQWVVSKARRADVIVHKRGAPILVVLSIRRYMKLITALELIGGEKHSRPRSAESPPG